MYLVLLYLGQMEVDSVNSSISHQPVASEGGVSVAPSATPDKVPTVDFGPIPDPNAVCSGNVCSNGHIWQPTIAIARCPGCGSPTLVVKMVNCPICNEPTAKLRLRTDHLPQNGAIMPMCKGSATLGDVGVIEVERSHALREQETYVEREMISKI